MRFASIFVALAVALLSNSPAIGQLAIDRLWVDFDSGSPNRSDLTIRNESSDKYYITVTPSEITDAGGADEKRVQTTDPDALGLLVTPNRLVVEPGGIRSIRLVSLNNDLKADRIYRVKIEPQVGSLDTSADQQQGDRGMKIKVLAAYDVLVTVRPKDARANLEMTRGDQSLVIRNTGNTNTLLLDGQACAPKHANSDAQKDADPGDCADVGSKRMYAGTEWKIPLKSIDDRLHFKERDRLADSPKNVSF